MLARIVADLIQNDITHTHISVLSGTTSVPKVDFWDYKTKNGIFMHISKTQ